jgi:Fe-S-cluster-containing hydrogenase component 2
MIIDQEICIDCESCIPYCPVEAITLSDDRVDIDQDLCVECGVCLRSAVCPVISGNGCCRPWHR